MGRMLETMKLGEGRRAPLSILKPLAAAPVQDCVVDWEIGEEVPYVEVGGPNKKVELSPALLQHPAQIVPQPPHVAPEPPSAEVGGAYLTEIKPMTASLEAWPVPAPAMAPLPIHADVVAYHQPDHPVSQQYASLLDSICGTLEMDAANVVMLLGVKQGVGSGTVLLNLAATAVLQRRLRVALVEARPGAVERLGVTNGSGLADVVTGTLALEKAICRTGIESLDALPAGAKVGATKEALAWVVAWLRDRYDLVLIHGPTLEDPLAAAPYLPQADGAYLVLPHGEKLNVATELASKLAGMGGRVCGLIHTRRE